MSEDEAMKHPPEPTAEECSSRHEFQWNDALAMALWYPQMGGYVGKAVVVLDDPTGELNDCVNVYVWHNGEFPFKEDDDIFGRPPVMLHHCDVSQFATFAEKVGEFQDRHLDTKRKT